MYALIALVFVIGYLAIALEHPLHINKAASALVTGVLVWVLIVVGQGTLLAPEAQGAEHINHQLLEHLGEIASILFFLMGAMTIVELVDAHEGFRVITDRITGRKKSMLIWVVGAITFFLSAALDNMTTTIVMCALLRKLVKDRNDLWVLAGIVVIAANAGGAWSPIGDVTTIMLWIGGQVTAPSIMKVLFVPSVVCLLLPLVWYTLTFKGTIEWPAEETGKSIHSAVPRGEQVLIFVMGLVALLGVPVFKTITHLPPYMGILLGLGVMWIITELLHRNKIGSDSGHLKVTSVLRRIDVPSVLFFFGILTAVSGLQVAGHLTDTAHFLDQRLGNIYAVNTVIGVLSAIVDNVPLVAAAMGMYPLTQFTPDSPFWSLLALCAGTGGSILIIGSASGVAAMGILGIDFLWYLRRVALPAALGYFGGILTFWLLNN
ncbi:MAG: sodium:proton antiporter NhaD [Flavobacteriales bacterium]|nr:sodium:proton antiporter NhaD [Flavobacteriales bacterium]